MKENGGRQSTNAASRYAALWKRLLMVIGLFLVAMALSANGCYQSDNSSDGSQETRLIIKRKYIIEVETIEKSRDKISVRVTVVWSNPSSPPGEVRLVWNPPIHSRDHSWEGGKPDSWDDARSWYGWSLPINPTTRKTESLTLSYEPNSPNFDPRLAFVAEDSFSAKDEFNDWGDTCVTHQLPDTRQSAATMPSALGGERSEALSGGPSPELADYYLWRTRLWFFSSKTTMTTYLCQEWMDRLQTDPFFIAVRFPVQPPTLAYTDPYSLPVVFGEPYTPSLALFDRSPGSFSPVFTASLEYKPRYFGFLENELPSAPGEHWLALGVVPSPTLTCPTGLNLGPDEWAFRSRVFLDLGGAKDTCADCVLPFYYCYEGQESPFAAAMLSEMLSSDLSITSHQGWGITCLGPQPFRLRVQSPPFELHGSNAAVVTQTQVISLHHFLWGLGPEPVTVTLEHTSALSIPWTIYVGSEDEPEIPLIGPLVITETASYNIWAVGQVPAGMPPGAETLLITATDVLSDARFSWTSDVLWVGEWVAPPPPSWYAYRIYLPLVVR